MGERLIEREGVRLCTEAFGEAADPPVLLIMGSGGSMLWWDDDLCRMLAEGGRFVIRYDHRDTGRSVTYPPGRPGYSGADLVADAAGVLDAYGVAAAHVVGVSMGGALAQLLALDFAQRVATLVLISTTSAVGSDETLPPSSPELSRFLGTVDVDWSDSESVVGYLIGYSRVLAGGRRPFDEARIRTLAQRDIERATNFTAAQNHALLADDARAHKPLSSIVAPTLVLHGTADPLFPIEHGQALAEAIPNARLRALPDAGHGVEPHDWEVIAGEILAHTSRVDHRFAALTPQHAQG
jgi:pimeloyl-ACP methyl ester carboxylesterase